MDNKNLTILVLVAMIFTLFMMNRCNKPHPVEPQIVTKTTIKTDTIYVTKPPVVITEYIRVNKREQVFINNTDTIHTFADCDVDSIVIKGEDKIIENTITIEKTIRDRQLHHLMVGADIGFNSNNILIGADITYIYNRVGISIGVNYFDSKFIPTVGIRYKLK